MTETAEPRALRRTRDAYALAGEAGVFAGKRVELVEGEIIDMSPMPSRHAVIVALVLRAIKAIFEPGHYAICQTPLELGEASEPEPDIAVCEGEPLGYLQHKPTHALLVIEIAETSLRYDRTKKASLYAKAGIPDYWIVNLAERSIEVNRHPDENPNQPYGYGYKLTMLLGAKDTVSPLAAPESRISVAEIVPE